MSRWTTPGEAQAYETGYIEGKADAFERAVMFSDDEDLQDVIYRLRDFPSAQPQRKKGKWVDGYVKHIENGELRNCRQCSECGSAYFVYDRYNAVDEVPNYCPNCGADMRKGGAE